MTALADWFRVFSLREAAAGRGRAVASLAVIAVSSALLVAVLGLIGSIDTSVGRLADGISGSAALEVTGYGDGGIAESVLADVQSTPGVSVAVPVVQTTITTQFGPTLLLGADARSIRVNNALREAISAHLGALNAAIDGVLAGPGLGVGVGDKVLAGDQAVSVVAVLEGTAGTRLNQGRYLLAPLRLAQRLAGRGAILDSVLVVPKAGTDPVELQSSLTRAVAQRGVVTEPQARRAAVSTGVNLVRFVALSAGAFAFIVSGFLIYTALSMSIAQRRPQLSRLRAIGVQPHRLVAALVGEVAVYGVVGGAIGAVGGIFVGRTVLGGLPDVFMQTVTARIEYALPWWAMPAGILAAVAASVAAAAIAARQVYTVTPVEAMAPAHASVADRIPTRLRVGAAVLFVVLAPAAFWVAGAGLGLLADAAISLMFGALIALGFAMGPALVELCARCAALLGAGGALAASAIRREPRRVWATTMAVTIAVAATLAINGGGANAVAAARSSYAAVGQTDIWISTRAPGLFPTGPALPAQVRDRVQAVPGVVRVTDARAGYGTVGGAKVMMWGLGDTSSDPLLSTVTDEVRRDAMDGQGAVVSRDLARKAGVEVGDSVELSTVNGLRKVPVLAIVPFFSGLSGTMGLAQPLLREWFAQPQPTALEITAGPGTDLATLLAGIRAAVPAGIYVYSGQDAVDGFDVLLRQAFALTDAIWVVVLVIATVAVLNMLTMSVLQRRRELGVVRAIGAGPAFIWGSVLAEGAAIGMVGGALGMLFGTIEQFLSDIASSEVWSVDVQYRPVLLAFTLAAGAVVVCTAGSMAPAVRASRIDILTAIADE